MNPASPDVANYLSQRAVTLKPNDGKPVDIVGRTLVLAPGVSIPRAEKFFNPWVAKSIRWVFLTSLFCMPVFLALGLIPALMAKLSERHARNARQPH